MAQATASIAGLHGSSQAVLEGSSLHLSGSSRLNIVGNNTRLAVTRTGFAIRAQQVSAEPETSRRAMLGLVAVGLASGSFVQAVLAEAKPIKVGPPPPPSGGLRKQTNPFLISTNGLHYSLLVPQYLKCLIIYEGIRSNMVLQQAYGCKMMLDVIT